MKKDPGFAPAKINLTLHVTGRRADGYHLLDSLVAFADVGDHVQVVQAPGLSFQVTGPMSAGIPVDGSNLVLRAALALNAGRQGASITLEKHLPAAAGIGGGSSDAAAALRTLSDLWDVPMPALRDVLGLGADVPVCLKRSVCRMAGIGEQIGEVPALPNIPAVLVNPGVEVSTPKVFKALECRDNPAMPPVVPSFRDVFALARWLAAQRNDLERAARAMAPGISLALDALAGRDGCLLSRMSGSGATCFGLFDSMESAERAAAILSEAVPAWWVRACRLS
jgi:4-diphosphocytidyl-2-C-methyl-D-erythritol kinase